MDKSLYRYRRDNAGSSTYNPKCVQFNLSECKNLLRIVQERKAVDRQTWEFLAREIAVIAHRPYIELLQWNRPTEETKEALEEFRSIVRKFINFGLLSQNLVSKDTWIQIKIFVEQPEFYEYYAQLEAEVTVNQVKGFLESLSDKPQIILFGSGFVGQCAYCLVRLNGFKNIVAFADNDKSKWGEQYGGCSIKSPEKLAKEYPDAYYLITNKAHSNEIQAQLLGYGIVKGQIGIYDQTTFPMACTNIFMGISQSNTNN